MGRHGERKIDTWHYKGKAGTLDIPVYQAASTSKIYFIAKVPSLNIKFEDSDINALKAAVFAEVEKQLVITWEFVLRLEFDCRSDELAEFVFEPDDDPRLGTDTTFGVIRYAVGTRTDGSKCHRYASSSRVEEGMPKLINSPVHGQQQVLIPDTRDNRQLLVDFAASIAELNTRLLEAFSPEKVSATLKTLFESRTVAGLPAAKSRPKNRKPD